jgi:hypothetical protein
MKSLIAKDIVRERGLSERIEHALFMRNPHNIK